MNILKAIFQNIFHYISKTLPSLITLILILFRMAVVGVVGVVEHPDGGGLHPLQDFLL